MAAYVPWPWLHVCHERAGAGTGEGVGEVLGGDEPLLGESVLGGAAADAGAVDEHKLVVTLVCYRQLLLLRSWHSMLHERVRSTTKIPNQNTTK